MEGLAAYLVTVSVFSCLWNPENGFFELDILFRVMYLYDTDACGAQVHIMHIDELVLSNETYGLAVLPIKHRSPLMSVISQLPEKTKNYLIMSVCLHTFWLATALILRVFINVEDLEVFVIVLRIVYFTSLFVIFFDICLGVVYIAHIQQSLTKGMILSEPTFSHTNYVICPGLAAYLVTVSVFSCLWNPENGFFELDILFRVMYLYDTDACGAQVHIMHIDELVLGNETYGLAVLPIKHRSPLMSFGGWVPMIASAAWMRGIIVLIVNIFNCKVIRFIIGKIKKKKVKRRLADKTNIPFPDSRNSQFTDAAILEYIGSGSVLRRIKKKAPYDEQLQPFIINDDTTWIALMFAYLSCRGVVQWIVNFWIVQDTYFKGLEVYRYLSPTRRGVKK
ncbi:hypothetical protein MSG28_009896 [Choristoneura fumiferana]|uniref:Uncharacterized protein n=1 Tax=Choristoneura fumiferana TaxID=7141 RepID=A0ACC0JD10_CHOFU|nr:hypothetical protein MSG28_009896 [Choristoneura fumiferana]